MAYTEPTSAFIKPDNVIQTAQFTDFSTVPSNGYNLLIRAKRNGRWWLLKGLKEQCRQDTVYQVLLQKEYEITSQLQHPMVVSVFSLEEVEGLGLCIVMEWIEGQTLKEWLAQGKRTMKQRLHVADMLIEALAYVQSRQTQHRDLKPSNIMLTHDGQHLKLIDFGLSDTDSHTILKAAAGTEGYMAPDGSSDIYSLGCILRELRIGWMSHAVVRKCCASQHHRYTDIAAIQRDLHRCWLWPRRLLVIVGLAILLTGLYLMNNSHTQQEQQIVIDTLKVLREENTERSPQNEEAVSPRRTTVRQHQDSIKDKKKEIDRKVQAYGIEQMLDTVSCQRNIKMPIIRIAHELENAYEEPELKLYIKTRYHRPWSRRINELPYE